MKKILILSLPASVLLLAGCDTGPAGGSATPTQITPERQAEIDAHEQTVEDEEKAHQASGS
jgi:uncharacterized lipoprotein YajG